MKWTSLLPAGLIVLLCWLLAQWTWSVLMPKAGKVSIESTPLAAQIAADVVSQGHLFDRVLLRGEMPEMNVSRFANLKLRGVFSALGTLPAFAILSVDGKPDQPVKKGAEIGPGLILATVSSDRVEVRRNGASEWLELDIKSRGSNGIAMDAEFRLNVQSRGAGNYGFSRSELNHALQDPKQLKSLGKFVTRAGWQGLIVEEAQRGSLAEKLGLLKNDVITHLNEQVVASDVDVNRFYQQLNTIGQVKLVGLRGGKPLMLSYSIQ